MPYIDSPRQLEKVEYIEASGTGVLDFAVADRDTPLTWSGVEDADWTVEDVASVENVDEDRFVLWPQGEYFTCDIQAEQDENNLGPVRCWVENNSE